MSAFIGSAIVCVDPRSRRSSRWDEPYAVYLLVGGLCYLVGAFGLTIGYHVPRNDALAEVDPSQASGRWAMEPVRLDVDRVGTTCV